MQNVEHPVGRAILIVAKSSAVYLPDCFDTLTAALPGVLTYFCEKKPCPQRFASSRAGSEGKTQQQGIFRLKSRPLGNASAVLMIVDEV